MSREPGPPSRFASDLPIEELREPLTQALKDDNRPRVLLDAPTGSGKSTQVPQMLLDENLAGGGTIIVLQPRRMAARLLASRVASERGGKPGGEVGYQIRFERFAGKETKILYVTEGILLRMMLSDMKLQGVGALIFDEFHERNLFSDVTLGRALQLQDEMRPDLRIVVMSATLDGDLLEAYLDPCERLDSDGRTFPVDIRYEAPRQRHGGELWNHATRACEEVVRAGGGPGGDAGHILIFMPGTFEIRKTVDLIASRSWAREYAVLPLYSELPAKRQDEAVAPSSRPKIIVSTNVAETSLTIDGVRTVIDSGLARKAGYDDVRGINTLLIEKIARAAADQRAGRAGRTAPGVCVRLWSPEDQARRLSHESPEILRIDLSEPMLALKAGGMGDMRDFPWLDMPGEKSMTRGEDLLEMLGATDGSGEITESGRRMATFPVHPRFARMVIAGAEMGCLDESILHAAIAQGRPLMRRARRGEEPLEEFVSDGDRSDLQCLARVWVLARDFHFDVRRCDAVGINAMAAREVGRIADNLTRLARRAGLTGDPHVASRSTGPGDDAFAMALLAGFPDQVARRLGKGNRVCELVGKRRGRIDDASMIGDDPLLVVSRITEVEGKEVQVLLGFNTAIEEEWLAEMFPEAFQEERSCIWDAAARRVTARQERRYHDLVIESRQAGEADEEQAAAVLAREIVSGEMKMKKWDHSADQWIARISFLRQAMPELDLPEFTDEDRVLVLEEVCRGARGYKEVKDRPVWPALKKWLSAMQRDMVEKLAPERVNLSNGKSAKVTYTSDGGPPSIAMVLQQLYDVHETPTVAGGKTLLVVNVLGPNHRPVQKTSDLAGFWKNSYEGVRTQLKGRYPRHEWR